MGSDKIEVLDSIASEIRVCRRCSLWEKRKNAVPGEGSIDAQIMFIGEAPGANEDIQGRPFVGAAGKLLDKLINDVLRLERGEVYITNVVKCRPPGNRDPTSIEIQTCASYLERQIRVISPRIIVALGRHSTKYLFEASNMHYSGLSRVRGKTFNLNFMGLQVKVIPTYHPAAALYNPRLKDYLEKDFLNVKIAVRRENTSGFKQMRINQFFNGGRGNPLKSNAEKRKIYRRLKGIRSRIKAATRKAERFYLEGGDVSVKEREIKKLTKLKRKMREKFRNL